MQGKSSSNNIELILGIIAIIAILIVIFSAYALANSWQQIDNLEGRKESLEIGIKDLEDQLQLSRSEIENLNKQLEGDSQETEIVEYQGTVIESSDNILESLKNNPEFSSLLKALEDLELDQELEKDGITFFLPSPDSLKTLSEGEESLEELLSSDPEALKNILENHIISERLVASDLQKTEKIQSLSGQELSIVAEEDTITINSIQVLKADIPQTNGYIHIVDGLIVNQ